MRYSFVILFLLSMGIFACKSTQQDTTTSAPTPEARSGKPNRQGPPDLDELFARMDTNKDGQLAKSEVKGRLAERFDQIDTDQNGSLSREEIEKAPRPSKGPR